MPANFATREELMARLKAKVAEVNAKAPAEEVKKRKREIAAEEEKKKKKVRKMKQKVQEKEYKAAKKAAAPVVAADPVVALKSTVLQPGQLPASEAGAVKTDPSNIKSDFKFAAVTQSVATKEFAKAGMVSNKKGHKQQQLREIEKFNERVQKVKESGDEVTAERMLMNKSVKGAMARAAGEVLKDDEKMLKRSLKRKERTKSKNQKVWKEKLSIQASKQKEQRDAKNLRIKKKIDEKVAKSKGTYVKAKKSTKDSKGGKSGKSAKGGAKKSRK
jgi:hypothetical protein